MANGEDSLNLGDVLKNFSGAGADNAVAYLHFSYDAASNTTTVSITSQMSAAGDGAALMQERIVLPDVNVTMLGTNDYDIVHNLFRQVNPLVE